LVPGIPWGRRKVPRASQGGLNRDLWGVPRNPREDFSKGSQGCLKADGPMEPVGAQGAPPPWRFSLDLST